MNRFNILRIDFQGALKIHYREIYDYHKSLGKSLSQLDLHFLFGAFPSICINSGGKVSCEPHRDQHNLGKLCPSTEFLFALVDFSSF